MEIPKDEYGNGHSDYQCYAILYGETKEEVKLKAEKYFESYDFWGYGTRFREPVQQHPDGYYWCHIVRWHSCD